MKENIYIKQMLTAMELWEMVVESDTRKLSPRLNRKNPLREETPMKKNPNEKTNKLTGPEPKKEFVWKLTEEDKAFLRSINVSPN